ncbi:MAG: tripartite tricarboxylate transporter TctB family protein, partial [candidate division WOR-3 bacterium]
LLSGLFLILVSIGACVKAYQLGMGSVNSPGPGFIPFCIGALLGLMSIYLCAHGIVQVVGGYKERALFRGVAWKKSLLVAAMLGCYAAFFNLLGFLVSTFVLMLLLLWVVGRQRLLSSLIVSVLTAGGAHLLFVVLFGLPLPRGVLSYVLGE